MIFRIAFLLLTTMLTFACGEQGETAKTTPVDAASPAPQSTPATTTSFDGERAFQHVKAQVEFGPRPAGSAALEKTRGYLLETLRGYGLTPRIDEFTPVTPKGRVKMKNLIVEFPGQSNDVIIIASHYDTKEYKEFRFVGANDGGSSTGALLEIARVMAAEKTPRKLTYQLVFFDGEEAFCSEWGQCLGGNDNTYGSRYMVQQLRKTKQLKRIKAMILLDMIGDKDLAIPREENSSQWLVEAIWGAARDLGYRQYFVNESQWLTDDHLPFLQAGIPAIDIIDFDYGSDQGSYWHTAEDTLDKVSARSLKIVGDVVLHSLPRLEALIR